MIKYISVLFFLKINFYAKKKINFIFSHTLLDTLYKYLKGFLIKIKKREIFLLVAKAKYILFA